MGNASYSLLWKGGLPILESVLGNSQSSIPYAPRLSTFLHHKIFPPLPVPSIILQTSPSLLLPSLAALPSQSPAPTRLLPDPSVRTQIVLSMARASCVTDRFGIGHDVTMWRDTGAVVFHARLSDLIPMVSDTSRGCLYIAGRMLKENTMRLCDSGKQLFFLKGRGFKWFIYLIFKIFSLSKWST